MNEYLKQLINTLLDYKYKNINIRIDKNNYVTLMGNYSTDKFIYFFRYNERLHKKPKKIMYYVTLHQNNKVLLNSHNTSFENIIYQIIKTFNEINEK